MSNAQRSTLKWEKEEALGEMATVAPVLYTNVNFPNLKEEFPGESQAFSASVSPAFPCVCVCVCVCVCKERPFLSSFCSSRESCVITNVY